MEYLIEEQALLWAEQRVRGTLALQGPSNVLLEEYFDTIPVLSTRRSSRNRFNRYAAYCAANDLPVFPLVAPIVALAVHALGSPSAGKAYDSHVSVLNVVRRVTNPVWHEEGSERAEQSLMAYEPLREYCTQARLSAVKHRSKKTLAMDGEDVGLASGRSTPALEAEEERRIGVEKSASKKRSTPVLSSPAVRTSARKRSRLEDADSTRSSSVGASSMPDDTLATPRKGCPVASTSASASTPRSTPSNVRKGYAEFWGQGRSPIPGSSPVAEQARGRGERQRARAKVAEEREQLGGGRGDQLNARSKRSVDVEDLGGETEAMEVEAATEADPIEVAVEEETPADVAMEPLDTPLDISIDVPVEPVVVDMLPSVAVLPVVDAVEDGMFGKVVKWFGWGK